MKNLKSNITALKKINTLTKKSTVSVLRYILITKIDSDTIELSSTDLDITVKIKVPCIINGDFDKFLIESKFIGKLEKSILNNNLKIVEQDNQLVLKTGKFSYPTNTHLLVEYPVITTPIDNNFCAKVSAETIKKIKKYCLKDITRLTITGFFVDSERLAIVATDGHRLYKETIAAENSSIVPSIVCDLIPKVGDITINQNNILAKNLEIIYKQIEGPYPNYSAIIPEINDRPNQLICDLSALKEIVPECHARTKQIIFLRDSKKIEIVGEDGRDSIFYDFGNEFDFINGGGSDVAYLSLNCKYLIDLITDCNCNVINFGTPLKATLYGDSGLLMPLRVCKYDNN